MLRGLICRDDDNIKKDRKEIGWLGLDWIRLAQDRDKFQVAVNTVITLRVPSNTYTSFFTYVSSY
jgi:hypothetical protein